MRVGGVAPTGAQGALNHLGPLDEITPKDLRLDDDDPTRGVQGLHGPQPLQPGLAGPAAPAAPAQGGSPAVEEAGEARGPKPFGNADALARHSHDPQAEQLRMRADGAASPPPIEKQGPDGRTFVIQGDHVEVRFEPKAEAKVEESAGAKDGRAERSDDPEAEANRIRAYIGQLEGEARAYRGAASELEGTREPKDIQDASRFRETAQATDADVTKLKGLEARLRMDALNKRRQEPVAPESSAPRPPPPASAPQPGALATGPSSGSAVTA